MGPANEVFVTGQVEVPYVLPSGPIINFSAALTINGEGIWTNLYPPSQTTVGPSAGTSVAVDSANNCYITGYSPGTNSKNNIVTIKYDPNGNQVSLQRYSGVNNLGRWAMPSWWIIMGTFMRLDMRTPHKVEPEMILIKYAPLTIQRQADGTVLLQVQGAPGQSFDVQASSNLQTWLDLGSVTAGINGIAQYEDTNAPLFDWRYYLTIPQ